MGVPLQIYPKPHLKEVLNINMKPKMMLKMVKKILDMANFFLSQISSRKFARMWKKITYFKEFEEGRAYNITIANRFDRRLKKLIETTAKKNGLRAYHKVHWFTEYLQYGSADCICPFIANGLQKTPTSIYFIVNNAENVVAYLEIGDRFCLSCDPKNEHAHQLCSQIYQQAQILTN